MRKKLKGVVGTVVVVVLITAAAFAVGVGVGMWLSNGGGLGEEEAVPADVSVTEEVTETTTETTTELITTVQNAEYVEVIIDGDTYFYSGRKFALDELLAEITKNADVPEVRISFSDTATQFAYEELVKKFKENGIVYTENN